VLLNFEIVTLQVLYICPDLIWLFQKDAAVASYQYGDTISTLENPDSYDSPSTVPNGEKSADEDSCGNG